MGFINYYCYIQIIHICTLFIAILKSKQDWGLLISWTLNSCECMTKYSLCTVQNLMQLEQLRLREHYFPGLQDSVEIEQYRYSEGKGGHSNEHRSSELRFIWNRQLNKICLFGNVEKKGIDPIMASLYNCPETSSDQLIYHHPKIFIKGRAQAYMLHNGEFSSFLKFSFWSIDTPSVDNQIKIKCLPSVDDICPKNIYVP